MGLYLNVGQILISITIILLILLQVKESAGLFGSGGATVRTRRGLEKTLFQFTIILAAVFLGISILSVRLS
ncbi:MAG: preprotein translocase subunit SecG [Chloroflexi bacterium]|nr:preprotein translocase subunit SecG [Chloroflexota bacterium]